MNRLELLTDRPPFSYHKFVGGVAVDFIGYHISFSSWQAGISEKRARWIVDWVDQTERANWLVSGRALAEFVGRMTFVACMLVWLNLVGVSFSLPGTRVRHSFPLGALRPELGMCTPGIGFALCPCLGPSLS